VQFFHKIHKVVHLEKGLERVVQGLSLVQHLFSGKNLNFYYPNKKMREVIKINQDLPTKTVESDD
jgi:hypothetical protein